MIRSMTGFGRADAEDNDHSFTIEIKSVNHRYLDLSVKMPRSLIALEDRIRKVVSSKINRGKVDIFVTQNNSKKHEELATFNEVLADSYINCLNNIKKRYKISDGISLSLISKFPDVISNQQTAPDVEILWDVIKNSLTTALNELVKMREIEGIKLCEDVIKRCDNINNGVDKIKLRAPHLVFEYKLKLDRRLKEILNTSVVDENRLAMEIAIFTDKSNIDEEIVRLYSHLSQITNTLKLDEPVGRKLDFIIQELNREANTISSKANDLELINLVLNIKNEIEKIREQVQNIE